VVAFLHPPVTSPRQVRDDDKAFREPTENSCALESCLLFFVKDTSDILEKCNRNDAIVFNGWCCIVFQFFLVLNHFPKDPCMVYVIFTHIYPEQNVGQQKPFGPWIRHEI